VLTVIHGTAELMLDDPSVRAKHRDDVAQIQAAAARAAALTRQLLAFSRRQVISPRVLRVQDVVTSVEPMLARLIGEHVTIVLHLANAAPVRVDPSQLEQVILNLAINGRDAMPTGGTLRLAVDDVVLRDPQQLARLEVPPGDYVRLTVSDTGHGMSTETMAHIFEPFFTTKAMGLGTGLGLATVYGIVNQSGGAIDVHSELERGTSFAVYLPRADASVEEAEESARPSTVAGTGTVLLVEDEDGVRRLAQRLLEKGGYDVLVAATPSEALRIAEATTRIDLLLSDLVLPEMSGSVLAEKIRSFHPQIKMLFMSGYTDDMIVRHGLSERTIALVEKPFSAETLLRKLQEVAQAE
jgi:CheY-like chemotaxis protein